MSQIQLLSSDVIDQIAAGEVVDRPSHMVKEIIENSIDAGATEITVRYGQGGRYLQVSDNGIGMSAEDLPKALARFATSKIKAAQDLWTLSSFGFRGEALASIAAVSQVQILSRSKECEKASRLKADFGILQEIESVSGPIGTTITIEKLFENTPARLKFLKSESAEHQSIKSVLKALALSHPEVQFQIFKSNELEAFWPVQSKKENRIKDVLGLDKIYSGEALRGEIRTQSYFTDPYSVQKTSKNIWLFVQNRWVQDRGLQAAVIEAYRNTLMHGEYPTAVVFVEVGPEQVDVNIHPTKSQVKFLNTSDAFRSVAASIREPLHQAPWLANNQSSGKMTEIIPFNGFKQVGSDKASVTDERARASSPTYVNHLSQASPRLQPESHSHEALSLLSATELGIHYKVKTDFSSAGESLGFSMNTPELNPLMNQKIFAAQSIGTWSRYQILGQLNLTYIVAQDEGKMILIDQHAAHERVAFEKLMSHWKIGAKEAQEFLFPLPLTLSQSQNEHLISAQADLKKLCITIDWIGPQELGVMSAPIEIKEKGLKKALEQMAFEMEEQGASFNVESKISDICATMACHSVVRAGQALSMSEMRALLTEMDQYPMSSFCPHGRPVSVDFSFHQIERDFGRIV